MHGVIKLEEMMGYLRIQKLEEMIHCYDEKLELEATTLIQKLGLMGDNFCIPLHILKTCTVVEKTYVGFSALEIRNSLGKIIGIQIFNDRGHIFQITLLEENRKNLTEYRISCDDFNSIIIVEEKENQEYPIFELTKNQYSEFLSNEQKDIFNRIDSIIGKIEKDSNKIRMMNRKSR